MCSSVLAPPPHSHLSVELCSIIAYPAEVLVVLVEGQGEGGQPAGDGRPVEVEQPVVAAPCRLQPALPPQGCALLCHPLYPLTLSLNGPGATVTGATVTVATANVVAERVAACRTDSVTFQP